MDLRPTHLNSILQDLLRDTLLDPPAAGGGRHFLFGRCWHLGSALDVNTYLNDIRFGRCWHLGYPRCQHLPKQYLLW